MASLSPLHTVFLSWLQNLVPASPETVLTVQNVRLVGDARFADHLPKNEILYIDSLDNVSLTMCAFQCMTHFQNCSAIMYNSGQGTCKSLKSRLIEDLVDTASVKKGWNLFVNDKGRTSCFHTPSRNCKNRLLLHVTTGRHACNYHDCY
jgi:hypothetical protein